MPSPTPIQTIQKISHVWSSKRECHIAVRIQYQVRVEGGCKIYQLAHTEELA